MSLFLDYILKISSSIILTFCVICIWHKLLNKKINFKDYKLYIVIVVLSITTILNYYIVNKYLRIFTSAILLLLAFKWLFKEKIIKSIITPIYTQLVFMVAEMLFAVILSLVLSFEVQDIISTQFGNFTANVIISLIALVLSYIPLIKTIYNFLLKITAKLKKSQIIFVTSFVMIITNVLMMIIYYKVQFGYLLIFNTILTIFYLCIILYSFKTKDSYIKVYDKYNRTLNSLKEYEDILDKYRMLNHENKNQLLTIRNMVPKNNKKTILYIDKIVSNKIKDDEKIMSEINIIPAGGLRGLIYSKLLVMKEFDIKYDLLFSNEIKTFNLISNIDESTMLDICQIIGVYIDNAIEETKKNIEKNIVIEMFFQNENLVISISNNYKGNIDLNLIENKGYTTKQKGHGYGLTLTKEIIKNNIRLSNQKKITNSIFTQILKIKM